MPTFTRAAEMTLRSGSTLRGLRDEDGLTWLVTDDLAREVDRVQPTSGNSMLTAKAREGLPGGELIAETGFVSLISIPHLASAVLDRPMAPGEDPVERLAEVLGEPVSDLFRALESETGTETGGDEETTAPVVDDVSSPLIVASWSLGATRGGVLPGHSLLIDADADVWMPVAMRSEIPGGTDPWQVIREVIDARYRCEPLAGPTTRHPGLRSGGDDAAVMSLTPGAMTQALSSAEDSASLDPVADLGTWRWSLSETLPRILDEAAPLRSAYMLPSSAAGTDLISLSTGASALGLTPPALLAALEMRGSITRTGSSIRPWRVVGDPDLLAVAPAQGHATWCVALTGGDSPEALRHRLASSGLVGVFAG